MCVCLCVGVCVCVGVCLCVFLVCLRECSLVIYVRVCPDLIDCV